MSSLAARFPGKLPERLPFVKRRKSPLQRALETAQSAMKVYTSLKVAQAGPKAAKQVAKGYSAARRAKVGGRTVARIGRFAVVPAGAAAGFVAFRRMTRGAPVLESPPRGFAPPSMPETPPVSTTTGAPLPGEPGGPKSGTTMASGAGTADGGDGMPPAS